MTVDNLRRAYLKALEHKANLPANPCWPVMRSFESFAYCAIIAESVKRDTNLMEEIRNTDPDLLAIAERGRELYYKELARRRAQGLVPSDVVEFAIALDGRHDPRRVLGAPSYEFQPIRATADAGYFEGLEP